MQLTHRNCWVNAAVFGWHIQLSDQDVYLHTLPMFHANGWGMPWSTTAMGCTQVVLRKVDGTEILQRVERHGVSLLCAAPAVVNAILDALPEWDRPIPGRDRTRIVVAGAPPPSRTIERVESELGWEFIQIYGLTETSPLLTVNRHRSEWDDLPSSDRARKLMRAGTPAVGTEVRVDGDGELLVRSNTVMAGYWDQPDETEAALEGGWFHTGDGGIIDEEGPREHPRPQEGRDHLRWRERLLHRGRRRHLLARRGGRGGGDRHPRRHLGRDGRRPGGARRRPAS